MCIYIYLFTYVCADMCICMHIYLYIHIYMRSSLPHPGLGSSCSCTGSGPEPIPLHLAWPLGMGWHHQVAVDIGRGPIWAPESTPEAQVAVPGHWPPRRHRCAACTCPVHSSVLTSPGPTSVHGLWGGAGSPAPCRTPGVFG